MRQIVRLVAEWAYPVTLFLLSLGVSACAEVHLMVILFLRRVRKWVMGLAVVEFMCVAIEEINKVDSSSP